MGICFFPLNFWASSSTLEFDDLQSLALVVGFFLKEFQGWKMEMGIKKVIPNPTLKGFDSEDQNLKIVSLYF